jgi:hypothetical protein
MPMMKKDRTMGLRSLADKFFGKPKPKKKKKKKASNDEPILDYSDKGMLRKEKERKKKLKEVMDYLD